MMKTLNIKLTDEVVCYETGNSQFFGFRASWVLQAMGHMNVRVLDGGLQRWISEKKPVVSSPGESNGNYGYKLNPSKVKNFD
mmetsp:Transcript_217/g.395  ORF Transcript_217/g.395 Transcript_217/m.395 type:complete len:82 (+) Transcript_217:284-529(+)